MPFDKETASAAGKLGGAKTKDPASKRSEHILLKTTKAERDLINEKAAASGLSRNEFIIKAILS